PLKGIDFVKRLRADGHEIEVLTGFPHYPYGTLYPGYRLCLLEREMLQTDGRAGVRITRTIMFPSHDGSALHRMLTYVSFAISATIVGLFLYRRKQFDIIHVYQGPATLMAPGIALALRVGAKLVLDVQDLWPESVGTSGMMKSRMLLRMLAYWSDLTYRAADRIIVLSNGYKKKLLARGIEEEKVSVIYNWCDESLTGGVEDASMPDGMCALKQQGKSIILYAGTMGHVQGLMSVLDAAALLLQGGRDDIHFAFVGDGVEAQKLKRDAEQRKLSNTSFYPRAEACAMQAIMAGADALLIHFKKGALGDVGIPQKTQAYLAAGRPVVMAANGEAGELMRASNAAVCCEPGKPDQIADAVRRLFMKTREEREAMGKNGARFYRSTMSIDIGIRHVIDIYESIVGRRTIRRGMTTDAPPSAGPAQQRLDAPMPHVIRRADESDIAGIVSVHRASFQQFFLTYLGDSFLGLLYREILKEEGSVALVAVTPDDAVVGFIVGVSDQTHLYRRLALRRWAAFAAASLRVALMHPGIIPRLFHAFAYVGKSRAAACPALLMSIAVDANGSGRGIGHELVTGFLCHMSAMGIDRVCLTTDRDQNERTNTFYRLLGFEKVREYQTPQKRWMNEYVIQTKEAGV
ncbi:MAG TPA: GNAT family N-acetyltransferase, partial [Bacteroidota bacterium]|nr:GNAT family N-acetyltransferase [Bacteroidota bacterium]